MNFVGQGSASAVQSGNSLLINQTSNSALLNWKSFNIGANGVVTFAQPNSAALALNLIFQSDPSRILGALNANGRIYLLNQNGIIFGSGAQVNVGSLLASSLNLSPQALQQGITAAAGSGAAAFQPYTDANGNPLPSGAITVESGARLSSPQGEIFLFAPTVTNNGRITTPDGQTILAAGQQVFLVASTDPNLRGLFVEVGNGGTVANAAAAQIAADRGNVTLAGAVVHQEGTITATTSVRANGSIRLQGRDTASATLNTPGVLQAERGGEVDLGVGSVTAVKLDTSSTATTVDVNAQPPSTVYMAGKTITIGDGATVRATAGQITAFAAEHPGPAVTPQQLTSKPDSSELLIESGATLDVSGATVDLPMSRNSLAVQLRGSELADSPLQRNGPLHGATVYVDVRDYGTRSDGSEWVGSPIGDLSADVANIPRGVQERNLTGGSIALNSQGTVLIGQGAELNVSGGQINWQSGYVQTSQLIGTNGNLYTMAAADPNLSYTGVAGGSFTDQRWGVTQQYTVTGLSQGQYQAGYVEGRSAGAVSIIAPQVAMDGNIVGNVVRGPYQVRDPATAFSNGQLIGSISDVVPSGASLTLGLSNPTGGGVPDFVVSNVEIGPGSSLGSLLTPPSAAILQNLTTVHLRPSLFGAGGVENLSIAANGSVDLAPNSPLSLSPDSTLSITAGHISIGSNLSDSSGTIALAARLTQDFPGTSPATATALSVAPGVSILAAGQWVNDSLALGNPSFAPDFIDGGSVSISAVDGPLTLGAGGVIDVAGGAHLTSSGSVLAGTAGAITVGASSTNGAPTVLTLGKQLSGFGLSSGGSLSVAANAVCIASANCSTAANQLQLQPAWFNSGGFASVSVASNLGTLELLSNTVLDLQQQNYVLTSRAATAASGTPLADIAQVETLPLYERKPLSLTLNGSYNLKPFVLAGGLQIDRGARILTDPLASVNLLSNSRILMDGSVLDPGGTISVVLNADAKTNYVPGQAVWLGPDARLDASGAAVYQPSATAPLYGTVLDGGTVQVSALRGYVFTDPASAIDVAGVAAPLDVLTSSGSYQQQVVGSNGGSIGFLAAEGMQLNGQLTAQGAGTKGAMGGSLTVTFDPGGRNGGLEGGYPSGDRDLIVAASLSPTIVAPGTDAPTELQGIARLPGQLIAQAGFDQLTFSARNLVVLDPTTAAPVLAGYGQVLFESGVHLKPGASLTLDAPAVGVVGSGHVDLGASYVAVGTTDNDPLAQNTPTAVPGSGVLSLSANLIDLIGNVVVNGTSELRLQSSGDIRATGVFSLADKNYEGALTAAANLDLTAQQIYPTTLADYALNAVSPGGTIATHAAPGTAGAVLSAGGILTLNANEIDNGGVLRAPLGELQLVAPTIRALPGSVLSTSLAGQTVPFGETQGGIDWTYPLPIGVRVYNSSGAALPSQNLVLQGSSINLAHGSTVDVSAGGDLLAFEFVPGPGGTRDVLSPAVNPNQFAIIPSLHTGFAPFDPLISTGSTITPGEQIYLGGGGGLAAGFYTVLPARYALLPGSYLLHPVSGYPGIPAGETLTAPDGGTIVSGQLGVYGTPFISATTSGYEIQPGSYAQQEAQFTLSLANSFFTAAAAAASSSSTTTVAPPLLPMDAGALSVIASSSFVLDATLKAAVSSTGRGAALQLAGANLLVTDNPSQAGNGAVVVTPGQIEAFGAQTLIIGGQRQNTPGGVGIDVTASSVELAAGTQLSGPELILAAQDLLKLDSGSKVTATGTLVGASGGQFALDASSSLLRVSVGPQVTVTRGSTGGGMGQVDFASSATITSPGSVTLDVGASAQAANTFDVSGSLSLAAPSIAIGAAPSTFSGVVFDPSHSATATLAELVLTGRNSIDVYPNASFSTKSLTLATPLLQAATDGVSEQLSAGTIQLNGGSTAASGAAAASGGTLQISAQEIDAAGQMSLSGFSTATLSASHLFHPVASGALSTDGALTLATGWISAASGASYSVGAQGDVTVSAVAGAPAPQASLGGAFALSGNSISGSLHVAQPSGQIQLSALGPGADLTLGADTVLDVSGHPLTLGGQSVPAPGGQISLSSAQGSVSVATGASLDVSAAGSGVSAGTIELAAPNGAVAFAGSAKGAGTSGASGGNLSVTAQSFDLSSTLQAFAAGGFDGRWSLDLTGAGDLTLQASETMRVASLQLTADAGAIDIAGTIDADTGRGGQVTLNASGPITVSGTISARATDPGLQGGEIDLLSGSSLLLLPSSSIDVSGTTPRDPALPPGGLVNLRLPAASVLSVLGPGSQQLQLGGAITGARQVSIEGYQVYQASNGQIGAADVAADPSNPWFANAASFAAQAPQVLAALGKGADAAYQVVPGIEVDSPGDLHLASSWNLYTWRFGGLPGVLTLRAGGSLFIDNSLSDGFADENTFTLPSQPGESWSYRLTAGALLTSANPLATAPASSLPGSGDLIIAPGQPGSPFAPGVPVTIRTGTGAINIATANDLTFGNQASVIYTAGVAGPGIQIADDQSIGGLSNLAYPFEGGSIRIDAGRDIIGPQSNQLYTEWMWRTGALDAFTPYSTAWSVAFNSFEQGVATLGGGNIAITAGRDIIDLSASTPSIGRQIGGLVPADSVVQVTGGGDLSVAAGRNLLGGTYYSDLGVGSITAGGTIGASPSLSGGPPLAPVLAIGAGSLQMQAGQGLAVASIVNPTLIDVSLNVPPASNRTYFSTYTDDTSVSLQTVAGDLTLMGSQTALLSRFPNYPTGGVGSGTTALKVLPPTVDAVDLVGSIQVEGSLSLWPAPRGNLSLIAGNNVRLESADVNEDLQLLISDAAPTSLPTLAAPISTLDSVGALLQQFNRIDPRFDAPQPVHDSTANGLDPTPVTIIANTGSVTMQTQAGQNGLLFSPKPLEVYAGQDIVNLGAVIQNLTPASVSTLTAGRDFTYPIGRDNLGNVLVASGGITVAGPGRLEIIAGRTLNLEASRGIDTEGNLGNAALSPEGASISVWSGIAGQTPAYNAFITKYLADSDSYDQLLASYVVQYGYAGAPSKSSELQFFKGLALPEQRGLLEQVLFDEIRAGGRAAAAAGTTHGNFTQAFTALTTLFPGSNPAAGETNPYSGDILFYFSRIYTLAGGDIDLLAPGGLINVGLAIPPTSFGISKTPSELGLVVQSTGSVTP
jgi:filamentous hemagglutinin family protein